MLRVSGLFFWIQGVKIFTSVQGLVCRVSV